MPGYSSTPLLKKLGIKEGFKIFISNTPDDYFKWLGDLPSNLEILNNPEGQPDFIHLFAKNKAILEKELPILKEKVKKDGMIWVSWYKKASKIPTDLIEDDIRTIALPMGLVDVKVCAVSEDWSGLKLVWRKELR